MALEDASFHLPVSQLQNRNLQLVMLEEIYNQLTQFPIPPPIQLSDLPDVLLSSGLGFYEPAPSLPLFTGVNPDKWIAYADRYFTYYAIHDTDRFPYLSDYFHGEAAIWFNLMKYQFQLYTWSDFTESLVKRFCFLNLASSALKVLDKLPDSIASEIANTAHETSDDEELEIQSALMVEVVVSFGITDAQLDIFDFTFVLDSVKPSQIGSIRFSEFQKSDHSPNQTLPWRYLETQATGTWKFSSDLLVTTFEWKPGWIEDTTPKAPTMVMNSTWGSNHDLGQVFPWKPMVITGIGSPSGIELKHGNRGSFANVFACYGLNYGDTCLGRIFCFDPGPIFFNTPSSYCISSMFDPIVTALLESQNLFLICAPTFITPTTMLNFALHAPKLFGLDNDSDPPEPYTTLPSISIQLHFYRDVEILQHIWKFWKSFSVVEIYVLRGANNGLFDTSSLILYKFRIWKPGWRCGSLVKLRPTICFTKHRYWLHYTKKVKQLKATFGEIQAAVVDDSCTDVFRQDEIHYLNAYKEVELNEELFFKLKSKIEWLRKGDKNSKFCHRAFNGRTNMNRTEMVSDMEGICFVGRLIGEKFVKSFMSSLGSSNVDDSMSNPNHLFVRRLPQDVADFMVRTVSYVRNMAALLSINDNNDFHTAIQLSAAAFVATDAHPTFLGQILEALFYKLSSTFASFLDPDIISFAALYGHKPITKSSQSCICGLLVPVKASHTCDQQSSAMETPEAMMIRVQELAQLKSSPSLVLNVGWNEVVSNDSSWCKPSAKLTPFAALYGHQPPNIACHTHAAMTISISCSCLFHRDETSYLLKPGTVSHLEDKVVLKPGSNVMNANPSPTGSPSQEKIIGPTNNEYDIRCYYEKPRA